jgi:hypothetical protein
MNNPAATAATEKENPAPQPKKQKANKIPQRQETDNQRSNQKITNKTVREEVINN